MASIRKRAKKDANRKKAFITGISGGLGRAVMTAALDRDWDVAGLGRKERSAIRLPLPSQVRYFPLDVAQKLPMIPLLDLASEWQRLDLLVLAAGHQESLLLPFFHPDYEPALRMFAAHVHGAFRSLLPFWRSLERAKGSVIFISSIQAAAPRPSRGLYAAAKAAVEGLTRAAAVELAPSGARAVCLRLGHLSHTMSGLGVSGRQLARAPLGIIPDEEVAQFIFALHHCRHLTGAVIDYDAGHTLNIWA